MPAKMVILWVNIWVRSPPSWNSVFGTTWLRFSSRLRFRTCTRNPVGPRPAHMSLANGLLNDTLRLVNELSSLASTCSGGGVGEQFDKFWWGCAAQVFASIPKAHFPLKLYNHLRPAKPLLYAPQFNSLSPSDAYMRHQPMHAIIGSGNDRRQAIIRPNVGILLIGPSGMNFSEIIIDIQAFSFKKMHLKMSSGSSRPFCLGLNVIKRLSCMTAPNQSQIAILDSDPRWRWSDVEPVMLWLPEIVACSVFTKIIGHVGHFRWLGLNVWWWWEISQILIGYIKSIGQMSDEPWKFFSYAACLK